MADMTELVGSQQWIDKAAKPVEKAVHGLFESEGGRVATGPGWATRCTLS